MPESTFAASKAAAANRQAMERMAKKACLAGDPAKGVEILAELYVDTNDITYLFNQGRCYEQNLRYDDAIGRFREYLLKGVNLSPDDKEAAQKHIETCESYLAKSEPRPPAPAGPAPVVPVAPPEATPAPPAAVMVAPSPQVTDNRNGSGLRIAGIAVAAVGVAALATGIILNVKANALASDLQKPDNYNRDTDSTRKSYKTFGWVGYGVGAAALAGGSLLYYLGWHTGKASTATVAFSPYLAPDAAGAMLRGAF